MTLGSGDTDTCVRCGLCLSSCPTFQLTGMEGYSPRGRIATARAIAAGVSPGPVEAEYIDTCLGCRACEAVCPSGVPYGRIFEDARAAIRPKVGALGRLLLWAAARRWRLSALSLPIWAAQVTRLLAPSRRFLGGGAIGAAAGLPSLKLSDLLTRLSTNYVPAEGTPARGQVVLFAGCVQDAWARDVHWATIAVLTRVGYVVRVPHGQVCCGALHAHAGRPGAARTLAIANMIPLERYEGTIVVNSAGCGAKLREYGKVLDHADAHALAARIRDVSEVVTPADVRRAGGRAPEELRRAAVHDPCHLSFAQGITAQPRALLEAAGYEVVELGDGGRCCGAAGMYSLQQPGFAEPLRDAKLDACRSTDADVVSVANPGCAFWMAAGANAPVILHPIQLVAMALSAGDEASQDLGQADEVG